VDISVIDAQKNYSEKRLGIYRGDCVASLEIGRVVMKVAGRESGKIATVVKKINDSFVMITGPKLLTGVKRRRANVEHLEPTQYILEIKEDASDEEIIEAYKKANLIAKFNLKLPSAAELKAEKAPEKSEDKTKKDSK
jgi:large subunit ribosomal protein L14e